MIIANRKVKIQMQKCFWAIKTKQSHHVARLFLFLTNPYLYYKCDWIFLSSTLLGTAPICLSTIWPPLMKRIAGIEVMP